MTACSTCRARKVKCDEKPNSCLSCEKLQLNCIKNHSVSTTTNRSNTTYEPAVGVKRERALRSCIFCQDSKVKCSGERPNCKRCRQRRTTCVYSLKHDKPALVQGISTPAPELQADPVMIPHHVLWPSPTLRSMSGALSTNDPVIQGCPPGLSWLFAKQLPPKKQLHALLDAYFDNIHPIRVFAFEHKPSFIRILDEGQLEDASDQALLHIMCALGARFYALDYSKSFSPLTTHLIQSAGSQWAKTAEKMFFADYSTISITKLKVLVLLHGQKSGNGNYAGSFLLTGLVIRMAHALQLNNEVAPETFYMQFKGNPDEVSVRESRRRLMWACYMIDVWAGSGVDHLTLLNERDLKIQLPCNERLFSLQIPCVTELLEKGTVLEILPAENIPQKPADNLGMAAYYVRIVNIWRRVLRFVKHMDEEQQPWLPGSGFVVLIDDIQSWRQSLPSWLDFSADNIYIQRETHQLGALLLIHCMYHHVMCDVHRIALPDLFKNQKPIVFHTDQQAFVGHLQAVCFEHAQRMSISVSHILQHGVKYFADSILPSLVYNSSRIMLYYIARVLDTSKADAGIVIGRTVELVQCNIQALRDMALIYPLAESLCITSERWLETVRDSLACGHPVDYIAPQDPSENEAGCIVGAPTPMTGAPWQRGASVLTIPPGGDVLSAIPPSTLGTSSTCYPFSVSTFDQALSTMTSAHGLSLPSEQPMDQICSPPSALTSFEQPIFKLDDLQNFFGREASDDANTQTTGFEAFGPFGWADSFSV